jgi:NADPH2:quinone reductase
MSERMKAAVVTEPGDIQILEKQVPEADEDEVRIKVKASGICHSDKFCVNGVRPGVDYPKIPGHEVAGVVEKTGTEVESWSEGDRVGVGWHGGHCFECEACRRGNFLHCENQAITGLTRDGGHAEYMVARKEAVAEIPEGLSFEDAATMMCAGVTTFNALRNTEARPGDLVAVIGLGGLGHLGVQYVDKGGFETVAISHSSEKEDYARELGADHFIDSSKENVAEKLNELGGAKAILSTAPAAEAVEDAIQGLDSDGEIQVLGVPSRPIEVSVGPLLDKRGSISGFSTGHARDSQDTLEFSELKNVKAETETFKLENYSKAYDKVLEGDVRFRAVITME